MSRIAGKFFLVVLVAGLVLSGCSKGGQSASEQGGKSSGPDRSFATIGTGGLTGVYYVAGGAVSKIVNAKYDQYKLKVTVESTGGSVFNINAVLSGDLEFGVAQSDRQSQAWKGEAEWQDKGPQKDLRVVCALHAESVTLVAADDASINSIGDLKGKRVNIGDPGSGNRGNAIDALENAGLNWETDIKAEQLKAVESAKLLQDGRIDAYFYTVGHPNGSMMEATAGTRKVHFVPIDNVDNLIKKFPYYAKSFIPKKLYPNATNTSDTPTYGVKATLITSAKVPDDVVYAVTKEIFENLDTLRGLHPAFETLTKENMLEGNTAPYHDGAMKYFKEAGLM
ncbi:TAXI family TRAP transporter solute-binding subunit [Salinispira pacifica]